MHGRKVVTTGTVATIAILAIIGGCSEATTGPTSVRTQDFASALRLLSGNQQLGIVGVALPELLTVKVVDAGGVPVAGATVLWQVRDGGGTITPPASTTGNSGVASVTWTLGTGLVANKAVAILQGSYVLDSAIFTASSKEGPPASMTMTSGASLTARVAQAVSSPLSVVVRDQYGHPVPKFKVTWLPLTPQSGTVVAVNDSTNASGSSTATWTTGTLAATQLVAARIAGLSDVVFSVIAAVDTSRRLTLMSGNNQESARGLTLTSPLVVRLADRFGNLIEGDTIVWNDSIGGGGVVSPTRGITDAGGLAAATWTLGSQLGAQTMRARIVQSRVSFSATARVGVPKQVTSAGTSQAQRVATVLAQPLRVTVKDVTGLPVPGLSVSWSTPNQGGSVAAQSDTTLDDGSASALWTLGSFAGPQAATLMISGVLTPVAFTATAAVDTSRRLTLVSGNNQDTYRGARLAQPLVLRLTDRFGNVIVGDTIIWNDSIVGGGSITPVRVAVDSLGYSNATWTLGTTVGAQTLRARSSQSRLIFSATARMGVPRTVTSSGNNQSQRVATTLATPLGILVRDSLGQPVSGLALTWSTANPGSSVAAQTDTTLADGSANATWTLGTVAGAQGASLAIAGVATPLSFSATAAVDTSRRLTLVSGSGQVAATGAALGQAVVVRVADRFGNLITGDSVFFSDSTVGGGTLSTRTVATDATGLASTNWTLGPISGQQSIRARLQLRPERVSFTATSTVQFASVSAGSYFTCAVTVGDRAFCWGFGDDGQRGIGVQKSSTRPGAPVTTVDTIAGPFPAWRSLGSGSNFVCGLSISRQAYCWGRLASINQVNTPTLRGFPNDVISFTAVQSAENHSCVLITDGRLACTGGNGQGQLGDGTTTDQTTNYAVAGAAAGFLWSGFAVGGNHTCAMPRFDPADSLNTSVPYCWGAASSGQLGGPVGALVQKSTAPVKVVMPVGAIPFDTSSLTAGAAHSCALSRTGAAYCWGSNGFGQLGKGTAIIRDSVPQLVTGGLLFSKIFAGEYHTCGVTTGGDAYCWGRNTSGQLGNGNTTNSNTPVPVSGGRTWASLSLGELHTCGVASPSGTGSGTQTGAGVIYCWGDNEFGQLGTGTASANGVPVLSPTPVKGQVANP